jgi:hypothetical protein
VKEFEPISEQDDALAKKKRDFSSPTKIDGLALFESLQHPADGRFDIVLMKPLQPLTRF